LKRRYDAGWYEDDLLSIAKISERIPQFCGMLYLLLNKDVEHKCATQAKPHSIPSVGYKKITPQLFAGLFLM
jgi:hypothetical protein